ncbi:hypothetical protein HDU76_014104 [Blyttiomyces sp. JEL0837]|nr:hypothetical protein HDU76_014104 [Blyttiomyces sp. JEL0837]
MKTRSKTKAGAKGKKPLAATATNSNTNTTNTTTSTTAAKPVSLWDTLPAEIKLKVLKNTDLLTQLLNNLITSEDVEKNATELWRLVILYDYQGDLSIFPQSWFPGTGKGYGMMATRAMYSRLCAAMPDFIYEGYFKSQISDEMNEGWITKFDRKTGKPKRNWFTAENGNVSRWIERFRDVEDRILGDDDDGSYLLLHIPLRRRWMDLIPGWLLADDATKIKLIPTLGYHGHADLLRNLIVDLKEKKHVDLPTAMLLALVGASRQGHADVVQMISDGELVKLDQFHLCMCAQQGLCWAAENGHPAVAKLLLAVPMVALATNIMNGAFQKACHYGNAEIVRMLLIVERVNASAQNNEAIVTASTYGNHEVVKVLLSVNGVDATAQNNQAVRSAAALGHWKVVKLLLEVDRVDPGAANNEAISRAAFRGHLEVVRLLLGSGKVDATANNNDAIKRAAAEGHFEVVKLLLTVNGVKLDAIDNQNYLQGGVDISANNNEAFRKAVEKGQVEMVKFLLLQSGVDAGANNNEAIRKAAKSGETEMVKLLLLQKGVDPTANDNEALKFSILHGHGEVMKALVLDPRVHAETHTES